MITIEQLSGAARVAEVQPYPTRVYLHDKGLIIEARQNGLVAEHAVPWSQLADGSNAATGNAFDSIRKAMKTGLASQARAIAEVGD